MAPSSVFRSANSTTFHHQASPELPHKQYRRSDSSTTTTTTANTMKSLSDHTTTTNHYGDDDTNSTSSSVTSWLPSSFMSSWDDDNDDTTSNSLLNTSASSYDYDDASSFYKPTSPKPKQSKPKIVAQPKQKKLDLEMELRTSHHALVGSIMAVLNLLKQSGVPQPSIDELQRNLDMERYFAVLKRCQDYIHCLAVQSRANNGNNTTTTKHTNTIPAKTHLILCTWESLCRYKRIQYRIAYKQCFTLRYESTTASNQMIQKAISIQIQMAEQCTACQKKYYLAKKWQSQFVCQQQIAPHGYQSIRCLQ